ncbi:hypothetical protein ACS15_4786 [Ralstonia insidiosa]|uniref:Uncharacterized protein n=1 Tax=Ralstonia insidiosa TaxID=190721 RepID=A0AAC9FTV3_9RALS|nr:hypothetical protein ACS15_4786 [Ralstonia insidiosa]
MLSLPRCSPPVRLLKAPVAITRTTSVTRTIITIACTAKNETGQ